MAVVVRPARPGEAATLTALCIRSKAHWAYDDAFMKLSAAALVVDAADIAAGRVLVAAAAEGPALGMAAVLGDGETVDLDSLFVDPPAIGSGAGRLLFQQHEKSIIVLGSILRRCAQLLGHAGINK